MSRKSKESFSTVHHGVSRLSQEFAKMGGYANGYLRRKIKRARNVVVNAARTRLKKSIFMPTSQSKQHFGNLATGEMKRTSLSRKDFLSHARTLSELNAARYIWNHPQKLNFVRISPLGEGKNLNAIKDVASIDRKLKKGIMHFNVYRFKYRHKVWTVKTARYKKGYETLYHIK